MKVTKQKIIIGFIAFALILIIGVGLFIKSQYVLPLLMYHSVDENEQVSKLSVSPENLENQIRFLKKHNYNIVTLNELVTLIDDKNSIPSKTVCLTFDDGYKNNYTKAFPILKKYNVPATIFVISGFVDTKNDYLTSAQIKEMVNSGLVEIGAHTVDHTYLPHLTLEEAKYQIAESKNMLEAITQQPVRHFCYPAGGFNADIRDIVIRSGYASACATNPGPTYPAHDIYAMKRVRISRTSQNLLVFFIESSGFYTLIKEIRDEA